MPSPDTPQTPATLTNEQVLAFLLDATGDLDTAEVLQERLPSWLLKASAEALAALAQTARELRASQAKAQAGLSRLQPLKAFCASGLTHTLRERWPVAFEVEQDGLVLKGVQHGKRTLLDAAMQNFTEEEAGAGGLPKGSEIQLKSRPQGVAGLTPSAFAGLCRRLDLGRRYQEHFAQVFGLQARAGQTEVTGTLGQDIVHLKKSLLAFDMHLALMKGDITPAGYRMLQRLVEADGAADAKTLHYEERPVRMQGLGLQGICIWGAVVFSHRSVEEHPDEACLVYMPGEPYRPLFEYPDFNTFKLYLTLKLGVRSYAAPFSRYLDEDSRAGFFKDFARTRTLGRVESRPIARPLFDFMLHSHVGKLQIDARVLAVPTADVDAEASRERWLGHVDTGMTLAALAGFFLPVVGELMMGVALGQLLAEAFEGVEDWSAGERHDALSHMLDVAQNIALMAATAGAAKTVGTVVSRTLARHPEFFGRFAAVLDRSGWPKLWRQSLQTYEQPAADGPAQADFSGLYRIQERMFLQIDGKHYAVALDPASQTWRIQHPSRPEAFRPEPLPNGEGGWFGPGEQVEQWRNPAYVLKRINPSLSGIEDSRLDMIRRLTDTPPDVLHRLAQDSEPLPQRLKDMVKRFELDGQLRRFIADMEQGDVRNVRHVQEQLHALPLLKGWPQGRYIEVLDDQANIVATYPSSALSGPDLCVHVRDAQLADGQLLQAVIDGLYPQEMQALIGVPASSGDRAVQLAKRLGAETKAERRPLFELMYRQYDQGPSSDVRVALNRFPDLPVRSAQQLVDLAPSLERLHLRAVGRLPMGLAQRMRQARDAIRMDRALAGFHLPELANADTERLGIRLLPRLDGWPADRRLELREESRHGPLLAGIGDPGAETAQVGLIVRSSSGYSVFDAEGQSLGPAVSGSESLYAAVLNSLPEQARRAVGFAETSPEAAGRLRGRLLAAALDDRADAERALFTEQPWPVRRGVTCVQHDSPVGSPNIPGALMRKVRRLYPLFSDVQANAFLVGLAADPLGRARAVRQLQQALKDLTDSLEGWSEDKEALNAVGTELREARHSRQQAVRMIVDAWRHRTRTSDGQCSLRLDGMRIGQLPHLPASVSFDHVQQLSLKNMELNDDSVYFLKAFRKVESLDLDGNRLTRLPEAVSHMPALTRLSLSDNRVQLTEQTLAKLSGLRSLQALNLSGNVLGATPDVGKMFDLRLLALRNTRATELPKGLSRLPNLDRVDLRDNDIRQLPDWLFQMPRRMSETVNLRHNPLVDPSRTRLLEYRERVGVGMGFIDDDLSRLNEQQARALWFTDRAGQRFEQRNSVWTAFKDDPRADGLFRLLSEVGNTADSEYVHRDMARRVWRVLEAAEADATLCEQILDLAANPIHCTDSAALNFSHLEVAVEVHQITHRQTDAETRAADLLKLGRRLFRLEQVDKLAQAHIDSHPRVDPLEVGLAYRTGLADELDLPGQPKHMRFEFLSGVTREDLEAALIKVKHAELSTEFAAFLAQQPFWCDVMKLHHPRQFETAQAIYPPRLQALFEKADTLTTADYLEQVEAISSERQSAETNLMKRLTEDVIKRIELGVCALADL